MDGAVDDGDNGTGAGVGLFLGAAAGCFFGAAAGVGAAGARGAAPAGGSGDMMLTGGIDEAVGKSVLVGLPFA